VGFSKKNIPNKLALMGFCPKRDVAPASLAAYDQVSSLGGARPCPWCHHCFVTSIILSSATRSISLFCGSIPARAGI
jgi:hypothetical protein